MYKFFALSLLVAAAAAVPAPDMGLDCLNSEDLVSCFAVKAAATLNRASRSAEVQLVDGVSFVRETPLERSGKSMPQSEKQILSELPQDSTERALKVSGMIYDSAVNFFKSHSLKVDPEGTVSRAIESKVSEGRAKVKKFLPLLYSLAGFKIFALIPVVLGGLALMVLKALVIGKVALLVAGVLAFQKLMGSGSGFPTLFNKHNPATSGWTDQNSQTWAASASVQPQGYYRRSFEQDAHNLAYSAHAPTTTQTS